MLNDDHENTQNQETSMCKLNWFYEMSVISLAVVKWMQQKCMIIKEVDKWHGLFHCSLEKDIGIWEASEPWVWWMHWTINGMKPAYYLKLFWSMCCLVISFPNILCMGPVLYPEESYSIVHIWCFACHFT